MKINVLLQNCVFFVSVLLFICCSKESVLPEENRDDDMKTIEQPDSSLNTAPDFTLKDTSGSDVRLSSHKGKVVVLFFLGSGCPSCRAVAPQIQSKVVTTFSSGDVIVLGLDQWDGNLATVKNFKSVTQVTFPLLLDASDVARQYKTTFDRLIVIDQSGNIHFRGANLASQNLPTVIEKIKSLTQN
jgi:peroxiredoxin